jgi:chromosome partitioning protein
VILSKGGVGKTTTAVNLSAGLALSGFRVLLVDTDTQGQDSYMLGIKPEAGLSDYLVGKVKLEKAVFEARDNLWVLAGGKSLAGVKRMIDRKDFGGERMLAEALKPLEKRYDYIIVDTSPGWDPISVNVLFYVKELLIPISLEVMSFQGLIEFMKSLSSIRKYRKEVGLKYILPTFLDKRIDSRKRLLRKLNEAYGKYICKPIQHNAGFSEAPAYGQTIFEFAPGAGATEDYRELVRQVAGDTSLLR